MLSVYTILLGLTAEYIFLRQYFQFGIKKALLANLVMNTASSLFGALLIPLSGIAWEFFPGLVMYKIFNIGTFNPLTWGATFLFAVAINAAIESKVLDKIYKADVGKKGFRILFIANAISVGIAFVSLHFIPVHL